MKINLSCLFYKTVIFFLSTAFLFQQICAEGISEYSKYEDEDYYCKKIKDGNFDFFKKSVVNGNTVDFFAIKGGSHIGFLYIVFQENQCKPVIHRLSLGPIVTVLTKDDISHIDAISPLKENEILIIAKTGGSGAHHVYGCLAKMDKKSVKVISTFPLWGHYDIPWGLDVFPDTQTNLKYKLKSYQREQDKTTLKFETDLIYSRAEDKLIFDEVPHLKSLKNGFEISLDQNLMPKLKGSTSISDYIGWILSLDIDVKTLTSLD